MNDRFAERLSEADGEIHTVCVGRPFGIDYLAAARRGIHVHVYPNSFDDVYRTRRRPACHGGAQGTPGCSPVSPCAPLSRRRERAGPRFARTKSALGRGVLPLRRRLVVHRDPVPWDPLDDRAGLPNRVSTYLLAGLPVISDRRPGTTATTSCDGSASRSSSWTRLRRPSARARERSVRARRRDQARGASGGYSFDATIDPLARSARGRAQRTSPIPRERTRSGRRDAHSHPPQHALGPRSPQPGDSSGGGPGDASAPGKIAARRRVRREDRGGGAVRGAVPPLRAASPQPATTVWDLPDPRRQRALLRSSPRGRTGSTDVCRRPSAGGCSALACTKGLGSAHWPRARAVMQLRGGEFDKLACFSAKDFPLPCSSPPYAGPPDEMLARGTKYFGEFAFELLAVIPYAYWLHRQGCSFTVSTPDTAASTTSRHGTRSGPPAQVRPDHGISDREVGRDPLRPVGVPISLDTRQWLPPPYRERFRDARFFDGKSPASSTTRRATSDTSTGASR